MNQDRLEWAIRTRQPMPLILRIEGVSYEQYRAAKQGIRADVKDILGTAGKIRTLTEGPRP